MAARSLTMAAAVAAAAVTLLVTILPFVHFAYRRPSVHLALDALASFVALLAAFLIFGRFRQGGAVSDGVLACSLTIFGFTNLFFSVLPTAAVDNPSGGFSTWAPVTGRLLGTIAFTVSAFCPMRAFASRSEHPSIWF